jgi:hypothetical protein
MQDAGRVCVFLSRNRAKNKLTISQQVWGEDSGIGGGVAAGKRQAAVVERNEHHSASGEAVVALVGGEGVVDG